jgi:hypothetical protein
MRAFFLLAVSLLGCSASSSEGDACASGVWADGKCLVAKPTPQGSTGGSTGAGGSAGAGGVEGTVSGAQCSTARELVCGHDVGQPASDRVLVCDHGVYAKVLDCPAPAACTDLAGHTSVHCGADPEVVPYAITGDPCAPEAAAACALDRATVITCKAGTWVLAKTCTAPATCHRTAAGTQGDGWVCQPTSTAGCVVCE